MARNPVPGLQMPGRYNPDRTAENSQSVQIWSKTVSPRMYAVGSPIFSEGGLAPPPAPSDAYLAQRGIVAVSFTAGAGTLTLPLAFPNGWLSLVMTGSDNTHTYSHVTSGATLSTVSVTASGTPTASLNVDIDAVGW